jgi:DNA-binding beta-propeller fold protein YncE
VTKRRIRLLVILSLLLLVLILLAGYLYYYQSTKRLSFNLIAPGTNGAVSAPQFLFAFNGTGADRLQSPVGIAVANKRVYVADSVLHAIYVYNEDGKQLSKFGTTQTVDPIYLAANPRDGDIYVSDRRRREILRFTPAGQYLGVFDPHLPKNQLPKIAQDTTQKAEWAPVALTFASDGSMYVTEVLNGHRLLIFDPTGKFKQSIGNAGQVTDTTKEPGLFMFPNGVLVAGNEIYVSDSNNRRVQVFGRDGTFKRFIQTGGLPRGITALLPFPSDPPTPTPVRVAVVDTLAHFVTIWNGTTGDSIVTFGEQGQSDGQFNYPDDIARGDNNKLFITDTDNGRVQVWGWPAELAQVPVIGSPTNLLWCILPFLFLPLLLLTRKRRFFATADFVERLIAMDKADLMPSRRRAWLALESEYERIKEMTFKDIDFGELFEVTAYSESDARALADKYELDEPTSGMMAAAQRSPVFCTEDPNYRRLAKAMEIDVVDAGEFVERYTPKDRKPDDVAPTGADGDAS